MQVISEYKYIDKRTNTEYKKFYKREVPKKRYMKQAMDKNIEDLDEEQVKMIVGIIEHLVKKNSSN